MSSCLFGGGKVLYLARYLNTMLNYGTVWSTTSTDTSASHGVIATSILMETKQLQRLYNY